MSSVHKLRFRGRVGWTMIELLVVIAIISILAAISIPVTQMFARNDLRDGARTIYTMLRAARMYAMTHNVETAVVYSLDMPFTSGAEGISQLTPMEDTLSNTAVRTIFSAAVMYRVPDAMNAQPLFPRPVVDPAQDIPSWYDTGTFVPVPDVGEFVSLPQGYALLLTKPLDDFETASTPEAALGVSVYAFDSGLGDYSQVQRDYLMNYNRLMDGGNLEKLGMIPVYMYPETPDQQADENGNVGPMFDRSLIRPHIAHVFTPKGDLKTRTQLLERYRILVAPSPITYPDERITVDANGNPKAFGIPIEIQRATGFVRLLI